MSEVLTCKDCQAFVSDEDENDEGSGVCILNPPQMVAEKDPESGEPLIASAFPKVNGEYTRCMQLIKIVTAVGLCFLFSSCTPQEKFGGRSLLGQTWANYVQRETDRQHGRGYVICRTKRNAYGQIVTECR